MSTQDRAPSFPFYAKDWLADPKCRALSWANKGRYIDLLASMWEHGREGCQIPKDTAERLFGRAFVKLITEGPEPIIIVYDETVEGETITWLFSDRLFQEAQRFRTRSAAAARAARLRWGIDDAS